MFIYCMSVRIERVLYEYWWSCSGTFLSTTWVDSPPASNQDSRSNPSAHHHVYSRSSSIWREDVVSQKSWFMHFASRDVCASLYLTLNFTAQCSPTSLHHSCNQNPIEKYRPIFPLHGEAPQVHDRLSVSEMASAISANASAASPNLKQQQRSPFFPRADAAVLSSKHSLPETRPQSIEPIYDPGNVHRPLEAWLPGAAQSFYPPKEGPYAPAPVPIKDSACCTADRYLRAFLPENERLRLSMMWYYTRGILDETELLSGLQEKVHLAQESTEWEYVVIGIMDINVYIRLATVGVPLGILPRGETLCAHTVTQPPGVCFSLCIPLCMLPLTFFLIYLLPERVSPTQHDGGLEISRIAIR